MKTQDVCSTSSSPNTQLKQTWLLITNQCWNSKIGRSGIMRQIIIETSSLGAIQIICDTLRWVRVTTVSPNNTWGRRLSTKVSHAIFGPFLFLTIIFTFEQFVAYKKDCIFEKKNATSRKGGGV